MKRKGETPRRRSAGTAALRTRLRAAEDTLRALQAGEVDALVVSGVGEERVVTLQGADLPYRILLDQMYAGAVTLTLDGDIVYCNRRFADMMRTPHERVVGSTLRRFAPPAERPTLEALLERASRGRARGDLALGSGNGPPVSVSVTFAPLRLTGNAGISGVIGVVVDATERRQQEEVRSRLVKQAMTAQIEERRRIARELHDETGQALTALLVGLRTIEEARTVAEAAELAERLRQIVAQTLDEVGRLSRGLHPSVLDDAGLAAAVTRQAQEFTELHGVAVSVRMDGLDAAPLPPLLQTTVYRVLQEALTNVAKHARARSVSVRLAREEATLELRVQDDGTGFVQTAHGSRRRLGLRGMRERAALLGGSVDVESQPGSGTTITAHFPLRDS